MRRLIVNRSEARVILEKDNFSFVRKVYPRTRTAEEAVKSVYFVGARFWVAEPVYSGTDENGKNVRLFEADPRKDGVKRRTLATPGYRLFQNDSRHVVEVVSVGEVRNKSHEDVVRVTVNFKKVDPVKLVESVEK